jgi:molybdenum cofactor cytidylyltransferase
MTGGASRNSTIAGLVLAAGESSRMGRDKALLKYRGRTFLETIVVKLCEAGIARVTVVLGHHAETIQRAIGWSGVPPAGVEVVINPNYQRGQTSSLQTGLSAIEHAAAGSSPPSATTDAIVLCLVDHPAFNPATVTALVETFERTRSAVVVPLYGGRRGHPVLIARPLFAPLLALRGDEGASRVIRASGEQTQQLEVPDPGILVDVDDPAAYHDLETG